MSSTVAAAATAKDQLLSNRIDFIRQLITELQDVERAATKARHDLTALKATRDHVRELSTKAEHPDTLVPLSRNIHFNATLVHAGEYYMDFNPSYSSQRLTATQTQAALDARIAKQGDLIARYEHMHGQLVQRIDLLRGNEQDDDTAKSAAATINLMPEEIRSDRGVAVKVGEFYEIMEFD